MEATQKKHRRIPVTRPLTSVPKVLIYEVWNGKPIYYKGYRDVLAGRKTPYEVIACSDLQGAIVYIIGLFIENNLNRKK